MITRVPLPLSSLSLTASRLLHSGAGKLLDSEPISCSSLTLVTPTGSDTTANGLRATLFQLMENPHALHRARAEIAEMLEKGTITFPPTYAS